MTELSVNVNKIALLRNSRGGTVPSVVHAAEVSLAAGAYGITVHPRPDGRHIRTHDVYDLAKVLDGAEFNIEGNPTPEYMELVSHVRPDQATLVPDDPDQLTSDHGWDVVKESERLKPIIAKLKDLGIRVSLFLDPDESQLPYAQTVGADRIELYTEPYARAFAAGNCERELQLYSAVARHAQDLGLGVNAGHDLNLQNLEQFCSAVPNVLEVSIGHALIADALEMGLQSTVRAYVNVLRNTRSVAETR